MSAQPPSSLESPELPRPKSPLAEDPSSEIDMGDPCPIAPPAPPRERPPALRYRIVPVTSALPSGSSSTTTPTPHPTLVRTESLAPRRVAAAREDTSDEEVIAKPKRKRPPRFRNYCITANNNAEPNKDILMQHARYVIFQHELAPTTTHPHVQAYVQFKDQVTIDNCKRIMALVGWKDQHVEVEHTDPTTNKEYCSKAKSRVPGTEPTEWGVISLGSGMRNTLSYASNPYPSTICSNLRFRPTQRHRSTDESRDRTRPQGHHVQRTGSSRVGPHTESRRHDAHNCAHVQVPRTPIPTRDAST